MLRFAGTLGRAGFNLGVLPGHKALIQFLYLFARYALPIFFWSKVHAEIL